MCWKPGELQLGCSFSLRRGAPGDFMKHIQARLRSLYFVFIEESGLKEPTRVSVWSEGLKWS